MNRSPRRASIGRTTAQQDLTPFALIGAGEAAQRDLKQHEKYGRGSGPYMAYEAGKKFVDTPIISAIRVDSTRVRLETQKGRYIAAFNPTANWQLDKVERLDG